MRNSTSCSFHLQECAIKSAGQLLDLDGLFGRGARIKALQEVRPCLVCVSYTLPGQEMLDLRM